MKIEILGTGCAKCKGLEASVRTALAELKITAEVVKIEDMMDIINFGVMATPALVLDGKVIFAGRAPSVSEIKDILKVEVQG